MQKQLKIFSKACGIFCLLLTLAICGCLTASKNKKDKQENVETYKLDLDNDSIEEYVEIENRFASHGDMFIKITKPGMTKVEEPKVFGFKISGQFNKIEFQNMDCDGFRQILIYYDTAKNYTNLVIYRFKNNKVSQIFLASSNCDIETYFDTVPRVKIAKNINGGKDCSVVSRGSEWESWAWDGEKFVKEH